MLVGDYRFDWRSKEEFEEDVREATAIERRIISWFAGETGALFADFGVDNSGRYQEKASAEPDYIIYIPIEVKFSREWIEKIHFKVNQIEKYRRYGGKILFINGYETTSPYWYLFDVEEIEKYPIVKFWEKDCYEVPADEFDWTPLVGFNKQIPPL